MKHFSTERYLTLGMALTADKAAMEQRVRGVFARKSSAHTAKILAFTLCIVLGVGCFTTACRPAETATAQPSSIPLETEEQAASAETTDITSSMQKNEREDISFLSGLTEAEQLSGPFPARIERAAVAIDNYKTLKFDADVIIPETNGYGIARLEPHVFSDEEYKAFMDYLEPGGDWRTDTIDGKPFSIETAAAEQPFFALARDTDENAANFIAEKGGNNIYYSKYDGVLPWSTYSYNDYIQGEMEVFNFEWPMDVSDAQPVAEQMLEDLGITDMILVGSEKAVSYNSNPNEENDDILSSRGWAFYFAHEFNGLNFGNMNCTLTWSSGFYDPLDYQMPMWEHMTVCVDESGIVQIDWQDALDVTETVLHNVAVVSPEEIADRLTERLQVIYDHGGNTTEATFRVTAIRLGAAAIGEFPLPEPIMSANQGLMVPCWEVETVISGGGSRHTAVYVFNAVDGGTLVGKDYEGWPDS